MNRAEGIGLCDLMEHIPEASHALLFLCWESTRNDQWPSLALIVSSLSI